MTTEEIKAMCNRNFSTHKAELIQDTDRYLIIDWRRADGSGNYYINFIMDKKRGSLIVSGDLGDSIATWYNPLTPANLKKYIHNDVGYYISKFQCSSDKYFYDAEDIIANIKGYIDEDSLKGYLESSSDYDDEEEFWEEIENEASSSIYGDQLISSESLREILEEIDPDFWEWLSDCGKRINPRIYLWAEGFYMACEQLGI